MIATREITYDVDGLSMIAHLAQPDGSGPWPAVLIGHDGVGLDEYQRQRADDLAAHGYLALAMDYYGGEVFFNRPDEMLARVMPLLTNVERMRAIGRAALDTMLALPDVDHNRIAALGYGAGGHIVLELARVGVPFKAIAVVHPSLPDASAEDWTDVTSTLLLCTGSEDPLCTPEQVLTFGRALQEAGVDWRVNIYGGAKHAFWARPRKPDGSPAEGTSHTMATVPGVGYHAKHATRAWQAVLDLFDETFQASSVRAESSTVGRPNRAEFSDHYAPFIALVPDHDIRDLLRAAGARRDATVVGITESAASIEPPAGKWNIRETLAHLADMERVMAYRALRIARGDRTPVSGVDQNLYAVNSYANERSIADLRSELRAVRASTVALFGSFPSTVWQWMDVVEGDPVSLRALAYIIVGHDLHHLQQLADRFGVAVRQNVNDSQLTSAAAEQT